MIVEKAINYKLFRCTNRKKYHSDIEYFKYSKQNNKSEIIAFVEFKNDGSKIKKEALVKKLLRSRVSCPKSNEHYMKKTEHEFKYIRSYGNSNRFYCICHKRKHRNRYEFSIDEREVLTINMFLQKYSCDLHKKLLEVYKNKDLKKVNNLKSSYVKDILNLLLEMGFSDLIIAKLLGTYQKKISRVKRKLFEDENTKINEKFTLIQTIDISNSYVFKWKIKDISIKEQEEFCNIIKRYKYEVE